MFPYIHYQIPHRQQDLSTNLTSTIYFSLVLYINAHVIYPSNTLRLYHPTIIFFFSKLSTTKNPKNTKRQILQILKINLSSKTIQSLSSYQSSPQEFEVRYLGFNFGSTPSYSTYQLIQKSTACLTQTMKKQFHFRNQPLNSKRLSYYKSST